MIELVFRGVSSAYSAVIGPARSFRMEGAIMQHGETGAVVAEHRNYGWDVLGRHYASFHCTSPVVISFCKETRPTSKPRGPIDQLMAADGFLYEGKKSFAKYDEATNLWHDFDNDLHAPELIINAVE